LFGNEGLITMVYNSNTRDAVNDFYKSTISSSAFSSSFVDNFSWVGICSEPQSERTI